ncbi:hypothetical protein EPR50_G00148300 [Perca flavescens]|uniref:C2H2-type domain-containing protein n=1 Tax=Perca flavescens TaxID=8167 RepID=A0A484CPL5_PERFV|nr:hypothetical protein EPR50_G00148300 [Perca flavescens]
MPRRKQQAPRRSAAYGPEDDFKADKIDEEEHLQDDGLSLDGQDADYLFNDDEDAGDRYSCQNSPLSNGTNPDAGYASPLSTTSDHLADLKTTSSFNDQDKVEEKLGESTESINGLSLQDSLAKMKSVYANLISDASWSSIALDMLKSKQSKNYAANNDNGSNHKESNGFLNSHSPGNIHLKSRCSTSNASATTNITISSTSTRAVSSNSNSGSSVSSGSTGGLSYDWHQAALAKTLQHTPYQLLPEASLFSTVQLYRQNNKLYGPVFTGASKFRCKDCSGAYDTLVGLTVHMNETGHYRDDNKDTEDDRSKRWSKPRKRSLLEMEGKEDAQKVLKCMYCGHSFESLQDLSVHMIKTKHYQKVPLKEPMPALTSKLVPPTKKRAFQDLMSPSSPESVSSGILLGESPKDQKVANPYVTPNNRYGYQNGASYTWQFEARKAQILKCMECGSSHDTLQQLTAHMMVTGHFLKVTNSASKKGTLIHSPNSPSPPPSHKSNVLAMEELVEKVTGKTSIKIEKEEKPLQSKCRSAKSPLPNPKDKHASPNPENRSKAVTNTAVKDESRGKEGEQTESKGETPIKSEVDSPKKPVSNGCNNLSIITDHSPEQPLVNPLSALQSIMNNHLGKATKAATPFVDPFAMLYKINSNSAQTKSADPVSQYYDDDDDDQPMDLTKSKNTNGSTPKGTSTTNNNGSINNSKPAFKDFSQSSSPPLRENALMDISDMVKNLTGRLTPKSTTPSSVSEKSDIDGCTFEDSLEELSPIQRRKGRQSNWNPQHLLILQAQFVSSLRETPEGKFVISDLGPQERVHICKFTGLSMTTISHWLANVKYQLKRTGGTKFLKNIDSGQPLFLCNDCASQFRTPSSYIHHLESHLGFTLKDLSKLSIDLIEQQAVNRIEDKTFSSSGLTEEDTGSIYQCKLCNRTFVSKHAIKLHLCKTHGKSPEDHLIFVKKLERFDKQ